jgi:hypothetical protein
MSIARQHAEWLSLLDVSGPFLSMPVLLRVFPNGLDAHDAGVARTLRMAYNAWQASQGRKATATAAQRQWLLHVLTEVLGFPPARIAEGQALPPGLQARLDVQGETLQPDFAILDPRSPVPKASLIVQLYPSTQPLDKHVPERHWQAKPDARMMELLRATDTRLGLVTNGEQWMLVYAPPKETTTYVSWQASLWLDEPATLRAFSSLLKAQRFFGVADDETLEAMLRESANNQQEVTDQLGLQVRRAVEILVQAIDHANQDRGGKLLQGVTHHAVYESALTVMMRLVFLFSAEERKLLLLGTPLYDQNYAVSTLGAQLREAADQHGEEVMEHRFDAWCRLLATFRAVHGGVQHDQFSLPAYGSSLFDPNRFPFLEGRAGKDTPLHDATPLPISNRVTLHLLDALQWLKVKLPGGGGTERRRLSFRGLDIEQIGHVYEGLLDHDATRANEPVLGLKGAGGKEPEIALAQLEAMREKGDEALIAFLCEETGRSVSAVRNALLPLPLGEGRGEGRWRAACNNDDALFRRVLPFAGLIRDDDFDTPVVINAGSVYVTQTSTRRATGTHYTPRTLTEPIVQHTLEPLVYAGPAEGWPREQWCLRSAGELLQLKVCDMAMGSGAFLVQTCRYLSERLVEAWGYLLPLPQGEGRGEGLLQITPEGTPPTGRPNEQLIPLDEDERLIFARRIVADRCLYGVDKNPMAVEMAKLSLWLITMGKDRPFTFLDHALKCGDSLVGASEDDFVRWAHSAIGTEHSTSMSLFDETMREQLKLAREKRRELEGFDVVDITDAERKAALLDEADAAMARVKLGCDLLVGNRLLGLKAKAQYQRQNELLLEFMKSSDVRQLSADARAALKAARKEYSFHWPFEFPEVFEGGGFSAFVGNPPFIGGLRISSRLGDEYLNCLRQMYTASNGTGDLCAYFLVRAFSLTRSIGTLGFVTTNTISQGDTRVMGLEFITHKGGSIYRAVKALPWPGDAAVVVSTVHVCKGEFGECRFIDDAKTDYISSTLDSTKDIGTPKLLSANTKLSFQGSIALGEGFILEYRDAENLIANDSRNQEVILPYMNGEDLTTNPDQSPSRFAIYFYDWSLEQAENFPECLNILRERVYPERQKNKDKQRREIWWRFTRPTIGLYKKIQPLERVIGVAFTSNMMAFSFLPKERIYSNALVIFASQDAAMFGILQSNIHESWVRKYGSTMKQDLRYTPSDVFETFPLNSFIPSLEISSEAYHEHRRQIMLARNEGLTKTYNRFHDPRETSADIAHLRALHVEMDNAVAAAYGWGDLDLGHGFHETAQGTRYTLAEPIRRIVLTRLLELNHERWEAEQAEARRAETEENPLGKKKRKGGKQGALPLVVQEAGAQYDLFNGGDSST